MDFTELPHLFDWCKKHVASACLVLVMGLMIYGAYSFIGGYANHFGETFVPGGGTYTSFRKSIASYTVIDNLLHDYLVRYSASRIGIGRFHNNIHDIGNNALFFVSYETILTAPGVSAELSQIANLSATTFSMVLPDLLNNKVIFLKISDLAESPYKELAINRGVKVSAFVPVYDIADHLIAMITIDWLSDADTPQGPAREELAKTLTAISVKIGGYFSLNK